MSIFLETEKLILKMPELSDLDNLVVCTESELPNFVGELIVNFKTPNNELLPDFSCLKKS